MDAQPTRGSNRRGRLRRGLIALVAAYALALHGILIAFAGVQLPGTAYDDAASGLELCLSGAHAPSGLPTGPGVPPPLDHCPFCFAGVHLALGTPPQFDIAYGSLGHGEVLVAGIRSGAFSAADYGIARPRGPPDQV
jgi:hypothetical protein